MAANKSEPIQRIRLSEQEVVRVIQPNDVIIGRANTSLRTIYDLLQMPSELQGIASESAARVLSFLPVERQRILGDQVDASWLLAEAMALSRNSIDDAIQKLKDMRKHAADQLKSPSHEPPLLSWDEAIGEIPVQGRWARATIKKSQKDGGVPVVGDMHTSEYKQALLLLFEHGKHPYLEEVGQKITVELVARQESKQQHSRPFFIGKVTDATRAFDAHLDRLKTQSELSLQVLGGLVTTDVLRLSAEVKEVMYDVTKRMREMTDSLVKLEKVYAVESLEWCPQCSSCVEAKGMGGTSAGTRYCCTEASCDWKSTVVVSYGDYEKHVSESPDGYRSAGSITVSGMSMEGEGTPPRESRPFGTAAGWAQQLLPRKQNDMYMPPSLRKIPETSAVNNKPPYTEMDLHLINRRKELVAFLEHARTFLHRSIPTDRDGLIQELELLESIQLKTRISDPESLIIAEESLLHPDSSTWYGSLLVNEADLQSIQHKAGNLMEKIKAPTTSREVKLWQERIREIQSASLPMTKYGYRKLALELATMESQIAGMATPPNQQTIPAGTPASSSQIQGLLGRFGGSVSDAGKKKRK